MRAVITRTVPGTSSPGARGAGHGAPCSPSRRENRCRSHDAKPGARHRARSTSATPIWENPSSCAQARSRSSSASRSTSPRLRSRPLDIHPPILESRSIIWPNEADCAASPHALAARAGAARRVHRAGRPAGRRQDHVRAPPAARARRAAGASRARPTRCSSRTSCRRPGRLAPRLLPLRRPARMGRRRPSRRLRRTGPEARRMAATSAGALLPVPDLRMHDRRRATTTRATCSCDAYTPRGAELLRMKRRDAAACHQRRQRGAAARHGRSWPMAPASSRCACGRRPTTRA